MSYPAWPVGLPQVFRSDAYSESLTANVLRTQMDAGPVKARRRFSAVNESIRGTMLMTRTQWTALRTFYYTTLGSALPFSWTHPSTYAATNFRFVSPPAMVPAGGVYVIVTLDLETVP